jgi:hypothetical protein
VISVGNSTGNILICFIVYKAGMWLPLLHCLHELTVLGAVVIWWNVLFDSKLCNLFILAHYTKQVATEYQRFVL